MRRPLYSILMLLVILVLNPPSSAEPPESINLRKTVTVDVVARTKDAVVYISTEKMIAQRVSPFGNDPFFQQFNFGDVVRVPANSLGSGFIVHADGYVVTNHHVIDRARQITVELADGRKMPADLISSDPEADLAILKILSDKPLPTLQLGDSSDLMIGEPAIAIGNPLGYSHSVSTGIVSAIHRDLKDQGDKVTLGDLIQTDAAINPGNSGGPLLNAYGQVIGINTAIRGDAQNIGFAIQVNKLRDLIPELMDPSRVTKVYLPVKFKEVRKIAPPATVSCDVEFVQKTGSRMLRTINGKPVGDIIDTYAQLLKFKVGDQIKLASEQTNLISGDKTNQVTITARAVDLPDAVVQAKKKLGIVVEQVTPLLAQKDSLNVEDGLLVSEVLHESVAAKAGIKPGDVIIQFGRYRVTTLDDLAALLPHLPESGKVQVGIVRGEQSGFAVLQF